MKLFKQLSSKYEIHKKLQSHNYVESLDAIEKSRNNAPQDKWLWWQSFLVKLKLGNQTQAAQMFLGEGFNEPVLWAQWQDSWLLSCATVGVSVIGYLLMALVLPYFGLPMIASYWANLTTDNMIGIAIIGGSILILSPYNLCLAINNSGARAGTFYILTPSQFVEIKMRYSAFALSIPLSECVHIRAERLENGKGNIEFVAKTQFSRPGSPIDGKKHFWFANVPDAEKFVSGASSVLSS